MVLIQTPLYINSASSANSNKIFGLGTDNSEPKIISVGEGASKFLVAFGHGTGINGFALFCCK